VCCNGFTADSGSENHYLASAAARERTTLSSFFGKKCREPADDLIGAVADFKLPVERGDVMPQFAYGGRV
jgi:hypothetical protein